MEPTDDDWNWCPRCGEPREACTCRHEAAVLCECRVQPDNGKKHHDTCPAAFENELSENS